MIKAAGSLGIPLLFFGQGSGDWDLGVPPGAGRTVEAMTPKHHQNPSPGAGMAKWPDRLVAGGLLVVEYAIIASLLFVAGDVLVRGIYRFVGANSASAVVDAIDAILVVVILLDLAHTVFGNLRSLVFPVRPFLIIGVLAGVRDILSASAHLTLLSGSSKQFTNTLISLGVGVGVVLSLLFGLYLLSVSEARSPHSDDVTSDDERGQER